MTVSSNNTSGWLRSAGIAGGAGLIAFILWMIGAAAWYSGAVAAAGRFFSWVWVNGWSAVLVVCGIQIALLLLFTLAALVRRNRLSDLPRDGW